MYQKAIFELALKICSLPSFAHSCMPINSKAIKILPASKTCLATALSIYKNISSSLFVKTVVIYTAEIPKDVLTLFIILYLFPNICQQISYTCCQFPVPHLRLLCLIFPRLWKSTCLYFSIPPFILEVLAFDFNIFTGATLLEDSSCLLAIVHINCLYVFFFC